MSVAFAEPVLDRPTTDARAARPGAGSARTGEPTRTTAPTRTAPRRRGPGVGPTARPRRLRFTAPAVAGRAPGPRACQPAPVVRRSRTWRLTDRGTAVVLVVAAALVAASIAVVGLTALQVTGDGYRPSHSAVSAPVVVEP